ncbi:MAG: tRNA epoxyqueuosine(34) reductase QueG [candidate division WOR-3 bacterium]
MSIENYIKNKILESGFDLVGITDIYIPEYIKSAFLNWINKGFYADMDYMKNNLEKRLNLKKVWENVRSVIVVGKNYYKSVQYKDYKISIYALSKDYHKVMKKKLLKIFKELSKELNFNFKIYVDTGPILEKVFAQKAGLGWQGKNSILINPKLGSYIFLSVILVDIELKPDKPFMYDFCGKCNNCILACPTNAILNNRTVDANKCISYWTIEYKGDEIKIEYNDWVFGCDVCQVVCPWNNKAIETDWKEFKVLDVLNYSLVELLNLTEDEYNKLFQGMPIKRANYKRFKRNIMHIMGKVPSSCKH